jgi:hypothetical protein
MPSGFFLLGKVKPYVRPRRIGMDGQVRSDARLLAQAELGDNRVVAFHLGSLEIIEQLAATIGHLDQTAAAVEIFTVVTKVFREVVDTCREERNLDFG